MRHIKGCIGGFEYDNGVVVPPFIPRGICLKACYYHAICTIHDVNNKFVDELLYLLNKCILPHPNSLFLNMCHTRVFVEKVSHSYESVHAC